MDRKFVIEVAQRANEEACSLLVEMIVQIAGGDAEAASSTLRSLRLRMDIIEAQLALLMLDELQPENIPE